MRSSDFDKREVVANLDSMGYRGFKVYLHRGLVHTPMVPFSVAKLQAACGVMVSLSNKLESMS